MSTRYVVTVSVRGALREEIVDAGSPEEAKRIAESRTGGTAKDVKELLED